MKLKQPHRRLLSSFREQLALWEHKGSSKMALLGSSLKDHSSLRAPLGLAESSTARTAVFTFYLCQFVSLPLAAVAPENTPQ